MSSTTQGLELGQNIPSRMTSSPRCCGDEVIRALARDRNQSGTRLKASLFSSHVTYTTSSTPVCFYYIYSCFYIMNTRVAGAFVTITMVLGATAILLTYHFTKTPHKLPDTSHPLGWVAIGACLFAFGSYGVFIKTPSVSELVSKST